MNPLQDYSNIFLPAIEDELRQAMGKIRISGADELHDMLSYHMGWEGEGAGPEATGKRIRPILVLLTTASSGGHWRNALPAAAAVELIHNFSLIHDDIEDNSPLRRGRPTVWKRWGIAQALNAGDAMFTLAYRAALRLQETISPACALQASQILQDTCIQLTQGQYLDIAYEAKADMSLEAYWSMIAGKTAALLSACAELGALAAEAEDFIRSAYRQFGFSLGLAFQIQDDLLGIWGEAGRIGKSVESDLVSGKKSLPVIFGLHQGGKFAQRWSQGPITVSEVSELAYQLEAEGARAYTEEYAACYTDQALHSLQQAEPRGEAGLALTSLAQYLLKRQW